MMQNFPDPSEEIFDEIKTHLKELSQCNSPEMLLENENILNQVYQKFAFLKVSSQLRETYVDHETYEVTHNEEVILDSNLVSIEEFSDENKVAEIIIEDAEFNDLFDDVPEVDQVLSFSDIDKAENEIYGNDSEFAIIITDNDEEKNIDVLDEIPSNKAIIEDSILSQTDSEDNPKEINNNSFESFIDENLLQDSSQKLEPMQDSQFSFAVDREKTQTPIIENQNIIDNETQHNELEQLNKNLNVFTTGNHSNINKHDDDENLDKKFKLSNIKGLKLSKTLFDDVEMEEENQSLVQSSNTINSKIHSLNISESNKLNPEIKLDLNDRIAFSQHLFGGSQSELNHVLTELNSFVALDDAKEFLSDIYYEKNWDKVDNYAQRLWSLVESRFL